MVAGNPAFHTVQYTELNDAEKNNAQFYKITIRHLENSLNLEPCSADGSGSINIFKYFYTFFQ